MYGRLIAQPDCCAAPLQQLVGLSDHMLWGDERQRLAHALAAGALPDEVAADEVVWLEAGDGRQHDKALAFP